MMLKKLIQKKNHTPMWVIIILNIVTLLFIAYQFHIIYMVIQSGPSDGMSIK